MESIHVLLVEDDPSDAALVGGYLSRAGERYELSVVPRLAGATEHLATEAVDVVLLDLGLPDVEGIDALLALRARSPEQAVIVLTGQDAIGLGEQAVATGADDFLSKHQLDQDRLTRTIRYAVARAESSRRLRAVVERNVDGIVVVREQDSVVLFANSAAAELFGQPREELVGTTFGFPVGEESTAELDIVGRERRAAEMRVTPLEWDGEPALLASLRDITDRRRAEDLQRRLIHADRLAAIGQLAAGVAHEVNNPAQFISANCTSMAGSTGDLLRLLRTLEEKLHGTPQAGMLAAVLAASDVRSTIEDWSSMVEENRQGIARIVEIVRDLGTFARSERDALEKVDVNDAIRIAINMTANRLRHLARVEVNLGPVPEIVADRGKLCQVFTNLLINAGQAIEDDASGPHVVRVASGLDDDTIFIRVTDTGCGIASHLRERIFSPFFTTKQRGVGTGLGLALSADIVRQHGGEILLASDPGEATRFEVVLPLSSSLELPDSKTTHTEPAGMNRRARVLVIDDEISLLQAFRRLLSSHHDLVTARGGAEALELLAEDDDFDAILCDLMMPDVDGKHVYDFLSQQSPHLVAKVVLCSGGAFTQRLRDFVAQVPNRLLEKPVERGDLFEAIAEVVDRITS